MRLQVSRFSFVFGYLLALALTATAQQQQPPPSSTAQPNSPSQQTTFIPNLLPVATNTPDDIAKLPTPTPTPFIERAGVIVETSDGRTIFEQAANQTYNPASTLKLATALDALRTLGPQYRFATVIWTNGTFDPQVGTITGDLIVSGRDPSFHDEHAVMMARELNRLGIRTVTGDLIVAPRFTMNFSSSSLHSGERLYDTLDATRRSANATRAWYDERIALGDNASLQTTPSVAVMGAVYVDTVPTNARVLLTQRSSPLVDVLKVLLCYSNNFMAERLGDSLGGAQGLSRFLISDVGLAPSEFHLASTSGLGINRVSPRVMMKIYRALVAELDKNRLSISDILPVAGVDPGTLQKRYTSINERGSVIAKTGTLGRSDGGVSALVGQMLTQSGETLYFVIFNQHGNVWRFRSAQDNFVSTIQNLRGGAAAFPYTPHTLAMRLADTELDPAKQTNTDEYEPMN